MKRMLLFLLWLTGYLSVKACPACNAQQPRILRGITHGGGPESQWDYLIISAMFAIVLATLFFSIKWLVKPGEKEREHIKRIALNFE